MNLDKVLIELATDPDYPQYNYQLGRAYEEQKQYASAISFYLRATELSSDTLLSYDALIRIYLCFKALPDRFGIAEGILYRAISLRPDRPEAYFLLSQHCELRKQWQLSYTWASVGANLPKESHKPLQQASGYYGEHAFSFQKAIAAWWIGLYNEAFQTLKKLREIAPTLPEYIISAIDNNLNNLWKIFSDGGKYGDNLEYPYYLNREVVKYHPSLYHRFRFKFPGLEELTENHSQAYQDLFILAVLNGKKYGTFVEIGCGVPQYNNNTYLLEKHFEWSGVSIDLNPRVAELFSKHRNTAAINADATKINYTELFKERFTGTHLDYLQIDCEPATTSYEVLKRIPLDKYRFAVITFEHDAYIDDNPEIRELSRKYLKSFGYILLVSNVSTDNYCVFEDWYVHPYLVSSNTISKMFSYKQLTRVDEYMIENNVSQ